LTVDADLLAYLDAHEQSALVVKGELAARDLVEAAIARAERLDPALNVVSERNYEAALRRAATLARNLPFGGVPILLKHSTEYPGLRAAAASRALAHRIGARTPPFVARLEAAGLVVIGKCNMPEGGLLPSTESLLLGPARNPWNRGLSCGGSSGGSAAAVAAGIVPAAQGSDGGGSIRIPAACCGVFGLKPTRGRVLGIREPHWMEDRLVADMMLTRSVRDAAAMLALVENPDSGLRPTGWTRGPSIRRLRIGVVLHDLHGRGTDGVVREGVEKTAALCTELGHGVREISLPFHAGEVLEHFTIIWSRLGAEFVTAATAGAAQSAEEVLEPWTLGLSEHDRRLDPQALVRAVDFMDRCTFIYDELFADVEVLLSAVVSAPTPPLGKYSPTRPFAELLATVFDYVSYTPLHNLTGAPAMSIPASTDERGLPLGALFAARPGDEQTLLELAYEIESARPWRGRRPC
jgi:amidase